MKKLYLFNIGNSDVQYSSEPVANSILKGDSAKRYNARIFGEMIWENYDQFKDDASIEKAVSDGLFFPIVSGTLAKELPAEGSKIFLFVTNQKDKHPQDTVYYGMIIRRYLEFSLKGLIASQNIEMIEINQNPSDFDIMKDFYSDILAKIAKENESYDFVFASLTGGTQAQNTMLLICGLDIFTSKFRTLYTSMRNSAVHELSISKNLIKDGVKKQIALLIRQSEYHAALEILSQNRQLFEIYLKSAANAALPESYYVLQNAFEYAHSRQVFDFKKALSSINACLEYSCINTDYFNELRNQVIRLQENDVLCIAELKENAKHLFNAGHYVDFLGRVFRFLEAVCDYVLTKTVNECRKYIHNGKVDIYNTDKGKDIIDYIKANCDYNVSDNGISKYLDNPLRISLLTYIDRHTKNIRLSDYMYVLFILSDLRNKTIMSHGFSGVSSDEIEKCIKQKHNELQCKPDTNLLLKRREIFEKMPVKEVKGVKVPDICRFLDVVWDKFTEYTGIKGKVSFNTDLFYRELPVTLEDMLKNL